MKKMYYIFLFILLIYPQSILYAAPPGGINQVQYGQDIGREDSTLASDSGVANIFVGLVNWFAWFVALVAVVAGLYSGFLFITAGGDDAKIKKAKDVIVYAIIGIIVALLSFSIIAISQSLVLNQ